MVLLQGFQVTILAAIVNCKLILQNEESVASPAQIKLAEENKYDQTGPGAKEQEGAYKTYKTLEEALIGYLGDPDTKLPIGERARVFHQLYRPINNFRPLEFQPSVLKDISTGSIFDSNFGGKLQKISNNFDIKKSKFKLDIPQNAFHSVNLNHPNIFSQNLGSSGILGSVSPSLQSIDNNFQSSPEYTYSYGVHDRLTGDSKSVHETRTGDAVKGFYTVMDPDGHQRTVHYSADDKNGFQATVQRTPTNRGLF